VKILTANDLRTGAVVWWDGSGWSHHVNDAVDTADHGAEIGAKEAAAQRVIDVQVIDGQQTGEGVRPAHIKDRIRALGPTVRLDLTLKPADPQAGNWVI
jgi:hypothetical protein